MKKTRIFMAALTAALLLAACGQETAVSVSESVPASSSAPAGSTAESSSVSESSAEEPSSAESEPEEVSSEEEDALPENAVFALEKCVNIDRMFMTPDGKLACQVYKDGEEFLRLMETDGTLLKEVPSTRHTMMREPDGFSLQNWEEGTAEYYTFDLEPCTAEQAGSPETGYSIDYSEDGKYIQVTKPDGSVENIYETGAEDYADIESCRIQVGRYSIGQYLCYSKFGDIGCYDIGTGTLSTYYIEGGFAPYHMWNDYLTGMGQGGEGGSYPFQMSLIRLEPATGELCSLLLPEDVWPETNYSDGRFFAFTTTFHNEEMAGAQRLVEMVPALADADLAGHAYLVVCDAADLSVVGYIDRTGLPYFEPVIAADGKSFYGWSVEGLDDDRVTYVYHYDLLPVTK